MRIKGKVYPARNRVWINGRELTPAESQKVRNHSPDGFNWGYHGSGPAQLALAICLLELPPAEAQEVYQDFKRGVIAELPTGHDFEIEFDFMGWVNAWVRTYGLFVSESNSIIECISKDAGEGSEGSAARTENMRENARKVFNAALWEGLPEPKGQKTDVSE